MQSNATPPHGELSNEDLEQLFGRGSQPQTAENIKRNLTQAESRITGLAQSRMTKDDKEAVVDKLIEVLRTDMNVDLVLEAIRHALYYIRKTGSAAEKRKLIVNSLLKVLDDAEDALMALQAQGGSGSKEVADSQPLD